ncbi:ABC transporter substrate-binding protein [Halobaculum gomorrense]|uniref:Peptide/nickel transport system substrate-binding protein n=1 Tax=Halobaculum gomorrense TaxID=43928 RepID=A0A1M5M4I9_9EURY|nr:ABC transporter substrate-binding protein [Halobaculum gomorrense]SHG72168.1 peptide/nickel transport system substrate-binding protein [Halobaculum gomorrense]
MDPEPENEEEFTDEALSGPVVDRRTTTALLSAAGLGALAGCTSGDSGQSTTTSGSGDGTAGETDTPKPETKQGGRLKAGWFTGSIDVLDPPYISVGQYFQVAANIFNGLVTLKKDLTVRGDLAKDWEVTNGGKTFTFQLREGVTFHNGTEFTAEDVRYTINRTISKETPAAPKLSTLEPVDEGGVVVEDDYTVTLNFEKAMAPALIYLTRGPGRAATIVCKEAIEEMGAEAYKTSPVGTGPFKVANHDVGSELKLDAYDDYFATDEEGTQLPYLDGVDITPIPEAAQVVNALKAGDIHFSNLVPLQNVSQVEKANEVKKLQAPGVNWLGLAMNQKREPFASKKARRGIAKVIDNEAYVDTAYFGNALPAKGPINKATGWVWREDKPDDQAYAPEEGKQLLEEAGADGASFSILTTKGSLRAAKAMRQQFTSAGLDVDIEQVTSSTYWDRYAKLDYDVTISGSVGDPDPDQSLWNFYRSDGPWNWVAYEDEDVNQWLADQRRALDRDKRADILHKIEDRLIADVPHVYLSHRDDIAARRPTVKGFTHIPYMRNFHTVYLDE